MLSNAVFRIWCVIFGLALYATATSKIEAATWPSQSEKRFVVYLTGQHNVVPNISLVSRVTHVALAFMRSEVFNVPHQSEWPLFTSVAEIRPKFAEGTKFQIAIGGWGNTEGFSEAAKTKARRELFAENVRAMIDATGADGVDIDWEYPGGNGEDYKQIPNSKKRWEIDAYPELLLEIRAAIGPSKLLTAAVPGLERDMVAFTGTTLPKIFESVDFLNVMTYDLMNRRDDYTKHHSDLHGSISAITAYSNPNGYPADMNVGLGFYIKWFKTAGDETCESRQAIGCRTELMEDPSTGADLGKAGAFSWHDGVPPGLAESFTRAMEHGVDDIHENILEGHYFMDTQERTFWSWDTPHSIVKKLEMVSEFFVGHGQSERDDIGGVFAWGLGEDAPHFEHLKSVNKVLALWEAKASRHQEL